MISVGNRQFAKSGLVECILSAFGVNTLLIATIVLTIVFFVKFGK